MHELVGTVWKHYKSERIYMIDAIAANPNTDERVVVYWCVNAGGCRMQSKDCWRPYAEFMEKFTRVYL